MDRGEVIKGFTVCSEHGLLNGEDCHGHYEYTDNLADIIKTNDYSKQCPYNGCKTGCVKTLAKDVLALLKEQEAVKPINMENDIVYGLSEISLYLSNIGKEDFAQTIDDACKKLELLKEQEADKNKYEYKYDHTDCLWYGSGDCPSTCSQYRDGWNDAMDYIFKDGKGYQPYIRLVKRE